MDGKFVENKHEYISDYQFKKPVDLHLMVEDVKKYVKKYLFLNIILNIIKILI